MSMSMSMGMSKVGDFNAKFDASSAGHGDFLESIDVDWSQLKFSAPKKASSSASTSDLSCTARASFGSNRSVFQITLNGATVDRVTHTRADFHTLFVRMPMGPVVKEGKKKSRVIAGGNLKAFSDSLDLHVIDVAKGKVDEWFNRTMSGDLIEEYYRGSTTSAPSLRFVISGEVSDRLTAGSIVNITVQLVGVQFRSQYFTCVWKIVSLEDAPVVVAVAEQGGFGFFPEDDEDPEEDLENAVEEDDAAYPTEEERLELVAAEIQRLCAIAERWQNAADDAIETARLVRDVIHKLSNADVSEFAQAFAEAESIRE